MRGADAVNGTEPLHLRHFSAYAQFHEVSPAIRQLPAAPRFAFGAMPSHVAADYFGRLRLTATGLFTGHDVTVGDGLLLSRDKQLFEAPELNLQQSHVEAAVQQFGAGLEASTTRLEGPHVYFVGTGYKIYGHWLVEILPKLGVLLLAGCDLEQIKLLVPHDIPAFANDMLFLLGFRGDQIVRFGGAAGRVTPTELLAPSFLHNAVQYSAILPTSVALLRGRLEKQNGKLAQGSYPSRIMVARRGGSRTMHSRLQLEQQCAAERFVIVRPETMSLIEQWRMFSDAREIIGEYGSALHGSLFSAPGTVVCGLRGSEVHPAFIQSGIGEQLNQPTGYVFGQNDSDGSGSYHVRSEDVASCLATIFSGTEIAATSSILAISPKSEMKLADLIRWHDSLVGQRRWEEAVRAIDQAAALAPGVAAVHAKRARILARLGRSDALAAICRAVECGGSTIDNLVLKAELLLRADEVQAAVQTIDEAMNKEPDNPSSYDMLSRILSRAGDHDKAIQAAQAATVIRPNETRFHLTLFSALFVAARLEEAEAVARRAFGLSPRLPGTSAALARVLVATNRRPEGCHVLLSHLSAGGKISVATRALLHRILPLPGKQLQGATASRLTKAEEPVIRETLSIDFSAQGDGARFRRSGWAAQEPRLVWTVGAYSEIQLPALNSDTDWMVTLEVGAFISLPDLQRQRVTINYNGARLLTVSVTKEMSLACFLPRELHVVGDCQLLRLEHPDCTSPKIRGISNDPRMLAICLYNLRLVPVSSEI